MVEELDKNNLESEMAPKKPVDGDKQADEDKEIVIEDQVHNTSNDKSSHKDTSDTSIKAKQTGSDESNVLSGNEKENEEDIIHNSPKRKRGRPRKPDSGKKIQKKTGGKRGRPSKTPEEKAASENKTDVNKRPRGRPPGPKKRPGRPRKPENSVNLKTSSKNRLPGRPKKPGSIKLNIKKRQRILVNGEKKGRGRPKKSEYKKRGRPPKEKLADRENLSRKNEASSTPKKSEQISKKSEETERLEASSADSNLVIDEDNTNNINESEEVLPAKDKSSPLLEKSRKNVTTKKRGVKRPAKEDSFIKSDIKISSTPKRSKLDLSTESDKIVDIENMPLITNVSPRKVKGNIKESDEKEDTLEEDMLKTAKKSRKSKYKPKPKKSKTLKTRK